MGGAQLEEYRDRVGAVDGGVAGWALWWCGPRALSLENEGWILDNEAEQGTNAVIRDAPCLGLSAPTVVVDKTAHK
jgi:hypothetical protein